MRQAAFPPVPAGPARRRGANAAVVALCLAALLHGAALAARATSPAAPAAPSVLAEADSAQPYGGGVSAAAAYSVARALARLAVLEKGAALLENDLAARMGTAEAPTAGAGNAGAPDARMPRLPPLFFPFRSTTRRKTRPPRRGKTSRRAFWPRRATRPKPSAAPCRNPTIWNCVWTPCAAWTRPPPKGAIFWRATRPTWPPGRGQTPRRARQIRQTPSLLPRQGRRIPLPDGPKPWPNGLTRWKPIWKPCAISATPGGSRKKPCPRLSG